MMFMMHFMILVLAEYASHPLITRVRIVHNSPLQGSAWLMEMLNRSLPVRCCGLLCMQRHVFFRLCGELKSKGYLGDSRYVTVYEQENIVVDAGYPNTRDTWFHTEAVDIIYKTTELGARPAPQKRYLTTRTYPYERSSKGLWHLESSFPYLEEDDTIFVIVPSPHCCCCDNYT